MAKSHIKQCKNAPTAHTETCPCRCQADVSRRIDEYPRGWNINPPPSFGGPQGSYVFSAQDVVASSLKSWIEGGYDYDYIWEKSNKASGAPNDKIALDALAGLQAVKPSDAGMFNLPVVVVKDLNDW